MDAKIIPFVPPPVGNVEFDAIIPADFEEHAKSLGYTAREYLWLLAEDSIATGVESVKRVTVKKTKGGRP